MDLVDDKPVGSTSPHDVGRSLIEVVLRRDEVFVPSKATDEYRPLST
jgi:hypothetical protein